MSEPSWWRKSPGKMDPDEYADFVRACAEAIKGLQGVSVTITKNIDPLRATPTGGGEPTNGGSEI